MFVRPQRLTMAAKRQRSKDRFGAFRHAPVNLDQLNGVRKPVARNVGKSLGDIRALERLVIDDPARVMSPPRDPEPAKAAVAVEDEHRTVRRRTDASRVGHGFLVLRGERPAFRFFAERDQE